MVAALVRKNRCERKRDKVTGLTIVTLPSLRLCERSTRVREKVTK